MTKDSTTIAAWNLYVVAWQCASFVHVDAIRPSYCKLNLCMHIDVLNHHLDLITLSTIDELASKDCNQLLAFLIVTTSFFFC